MKNKKIFFAILVPVLIASFIFVSPRATFADQASLSFSPISGGSYKIGANIPINIWVKTGGAKVDTIRMSVTFPSNLLEAQSVNLGSVYSAPSGGNYIDNNAGVIYWGAGAYGGNTTDATFATISFKAKNAGTASVSFNSDSLMISAGQAVPFIKSSGSYTIESVVQVPVPAPAPKPVASPQPIARPATPIQQQAPIVQDLEPKTINNTITSTSKDGDSIIFEGKTSTGLADISIEIEGGLASTVIKSDENGSWKWTTPKELAPGNYVLKVSTAHPEDSSVTSEITQNFTIIITEALESLFDVILNVQKASKKIFQGTNVKVDMKLVNFGANIEDNTITNVELTYLIEDSNRAKVFKKVEKIQVRGRETEFMKEIVLPKNLKPGPYFISASMIYGEKQEASSSDVFEIKNTIWQNNTKNILILIVLLIITMIIVMISKIWKKMTGPKNQKKKK